MSMQSHRPLTFTRYSGRVLRRAWKEAWSAFGLNWKTAATGLIYLSFLWWRFHKAGEEAIVNAMFSKWSYLVEAIPPTLITIGVLAILFVVKAAYLIHKESEEAREKVEGQLQAAETQSNPKLEIVFNSNPPFTEYASLSGKKADALFYSNIRIGVTHNGSKTIHHVQARLERLDFEDDPSLYELPLRLMHDNHPYRQDFSVDAGETQFVEVAKMGFPKGVIASCHVIPHKLLSVVKPGTHDLKIKVTGQDALPASIHLRISVTDQGLLTAAIATASPVHRQSV